jgi:6-pyruvoyltetrahydropterin/6-carboxytetrahydropterin synthase
MFTVERQIEIDAGHRVPYHDSQCRFLHGHRWKIVAVVGGEKLVPPDPARSDSGMVLDFGEIKRILMEEIHAKFDHRFILWDQDPLLYAAELAGDVRRALLFHVLDDVGIANSLVQVPCIPTSEGLAQYWAGLVEPRFAALGVTLAALKVWETPNSVATCSLKPAMHFFSGYGHHLQVGG